ncbi:hypothetical protein [Mycobacterium vicinigordonae]|uniref:Twin-arginine translocation pathway signal n=1 Tax=Mycobacterium vicinigordonae TaxID=1719132 RepID=A0A7D6DWC1_9MYCO|nr:hypothetical protein [Mycobacterium vicinigordonae]QLL06367.1 hypothetical protein H0P51_21840 [Mycobacterium vicinigordonae]
MISFGHRSVAVEDKTSASVGADADEPDPVQAVAVDGATATAWVRHRLGRRRKRRDADGGRISADTAPARTRLARVAALVILPVLALGLGGAAAALRYQAASLQESQHASGAAMDAAKTGAVAILSYQPATAAQQLGAAIELLTGRFKDAYTALTHDVIIPGAQQKRISTQATVAAVAEVKVTASHATVLLFVNQTVNVGDEAPSSTASTVKVALDKVGGHWLISGFDPV